MSSLRRPSPASVVLVLLSGLFTSLPAAMFWCVQDNTLHENGAWGSGKIDCRKALIGSVMCHTTRVALHRNQCDLSAWFGCQEIYLRDPEPLARVRLRARLEDGAWLFIGFDDGGAVFDGASGVRLSRSVRFPPAVLRTDRMGRFSERRSLEAALTPGWHNVDLRIAGGRCEVFVDELRFGDFALVPGDRQRLRLRGSPREAVVDDIEVDIEADDEEAGRPRHFVEGFDNWSKLPMFLAMTGGVWAVVSLIVAGIARTRRWARPPGAYVLVWSVLSGVLGWGLWVLDWSFAGGRYPKDLDARLSTPDYSNRMFIPEEPARSFAERFPDKVDAPPARVVVLGGSQTWGSGAQIEADVWTRRVEEELNRRIDDKAIRITNLARSGALVADMVERYRDYLDHNEAPDLVLGVFSYNDFDAVRFGSSIVELWKRTARVGTPLALVAEPGNVDDRASHLVPNHEVLRKLTAGVPGVTLIEIQSEIDAAADDGFLWWDQVHLTSAGQAILASRLVDPLERMLR